MSGTIRHSGDDGSRLERCIRDLVALNALPSMCIGRSPESTLETVVDALSSALSCELVYVLWPGHAARACARLRGEALTDNEVARLCEVLPACADESTLVTLPDGGTLWCLEAELPIGRATGRLLAGRRTPFLDDTDRVLVRSAANLVGATLESSRVLEAARRKEEFLAMLGHELRNPLAPILTAVELLRRHPVAAREQQVIERHTRHVARLVDDLLDISRVTRGRLELKTEPVALEGVLERALEIVMPLVSRQRHVLHVGSADGVTVLGDGVRLGQVFGNLLTNAAKFTPPRGNIDVIIERLPERVRISVRDTGRGIASDQLVRIFEPFVQADRQRDVLTGGLGLGLAIVRTLVEQHGGTISARSRGPGLGATFTVELPTVEAAAHAVVPAPPLPAKTRSGVRVLVVDDNIDVADLLSEALRIEGFHTEVEHDARAAIARWRTFAPHAAVLDIGLPELDGYQLAKALRAEHGHGPTLIAATGYGQASDRHRAVDAGFDCHFVKPVSVHDLVATLDERVVRASSRTAPAS